MKKSNKALHRQCVHYKYRYEGGSDAIVPIGKHPELSWGMSGDIFITVAIIVFFYCLFLCRMIYLIGLVWFLYLMAYQPSWIIQCRSQPCRRTVIIKIKLCWWHRVLSLSLCLFLSPSNQIVYHSWQVLLTASNVYTELMYKSLCWPANTSTSMCRNPNGDVAY